jgi:hypothetical protein
VGKLIACALLQSNPPWAKMCPMAAYPSAAVGRPMAVRGACRLAALAHQRPSVVFVADMSHDECRKPRDMQMQTASRLECRRCRRGRQWLASAGSNVERAVARTELYVAIA